MKEWGIDLASDVDLNDPDTLGAVMGLILRTLQDTGTNFDCRPKLAEGRLHIEFVEIPDYGQTLRR